MPGLDLAATMTALRTELIEAMAARPDDDVVFPVGEITVEFHLGVTRQAEAKGGLRFWVVEAGAGGSFSREEVHTVTMTLQAPVDANGRPVQIARSLDALPD